MREEAHVPDRAEEWSVPIRGVEVTDRDRNRERQRQRQKQRERQTDRQAGRQTDRRTEMKRGDI